MNKQHWTRCKHPFNCSGLVLASFPLAVGFETIDHNPVHNWDGGYRFHSFVRATVRPPSSSPHHRARLTPPTDYQAPPWDPVAYAWRAQNALAGLLLARQADALLALLPAARLEGAGLEHLQVIAGEAPMVGATRRAAHPWEDETDTIQLLRENDLHLLQTKRDTVEAQMIRGLLGRVPLPPRAAAAATRGVLEGEEEEDEGTGGARRGLLLKEVTGFVADLLSLLQTRYLVSPMNSQGKTPADVVGTGGVLEKANRDILRNMESAMSSTLRIHVRQRERARAVFMLQTTSYPRWIVPAAAAALTLLTFACCLLTPAFLRQALTFTVARFVPDRLRFSLLGHWLYHFSSSSIAALFLFLISQVSTLLVMASFLRDTCGMEEWSLPCFKLRVAQPLYDSTARVLAWVGLTHTLSLPVRTEEQCREIEARCKERLRTWGVRIAVANLQAARRRPRLTREEALLLMDGLAAVAAGGETTSRTGEGTGMTRVVEEGIIKEEEVAGELLAAVLAMEAVEEDEEGKGQGKGAGFVDVEDAADALSFDLHRTVCEAVSGLTMQLADEKGEGEDSDGHGKWQGEEKAEADKGTGGKEALIPLPDGERAGRLQRWQAQEQRRYQQQVRRQQQRQTARREHYQEQEQLQGRERPPSASSTSTEQQQPQQPPQQQRRRRPGRAGRGASHKAATAAAATAETLPPRGPRVARTKRTVLEILKDGGWTLVRQKKDYIYKREIVTRRGDRREQTFTT